MKMQNMLHMQVLEVTDLMQRLKIDLSKALKLKGVVTAVTSDDVPGIDNFGVFVEDLF